MGEKMRIFEGRERQKKVWMRVYDASNAKESLGKKQKKRLGCSLLDVESMFRFYESLNHEEYGTDCAFMTLEQAMRNGDVDV